MKLTLQNQYLAGAVELMQKIPLTGYESIARTRFVKMFKSPIKILEKSQKSLLEEYVARDENGNPVIVAGDQYRITDMGQFQVATNKLLNEKVEIDQPTYTDHQSDIQRILMNCSVELSGDDAIIYDALCNALDVDFEEEQ
ncbi:DUF1617 family protein [Levilactobacillus bambusae]|uniref:Uncharacterized protein n=1 Tax=Levilactobacillus bambusae TaxID=2024736 RepID=A0A2V1N107_9LACO|nr:DUF1617 family protein [Levilactobacillus bambusae]PWG00949.1 hypothetical protein DCM90_01875 [Levilactobacillus bambusae]